MIRGNGPMPVMRSLAQQLENAAGDSYPTTPRCRAATINTAPTSYSKLAAQRGFSQVRSPLRPQEAAERPGRQRRPRAHMKARSKMPIPRPFNSWSIRSARYNTNFVIDLFDMRRAIPRWQQRTIRRKVGILPQEDTGQRCLLSSITRSMPRRATRSGHELCMSHTLLGLPPLFFCSKKIGLLITGTLKVDRI